MSGEKEKKAAQDKGKERAVEVVEEEVAVVREGNPEWTGEVVEVTEQVEPAPMEEVDTPAPA